MAIPPLEDSTVNNSVTIELDDEIEGDLVGSKNYRFSQIGKPVPIKSGADSGFDPQCLPSQPLAVSERFRLLFVAHPDGFFVSRTMEVMTSAEEFKDKNSGRSIQELSAVDAPIGKVSILALSADDSTLAATVGSVVHFFAVSALLYKEQKPSFSVSLDDSSCIKDMRWTRKVGKVYVTLAANGKLYHGSGQGPLNYVMENVDAVDWSTTGNFIAVARKNVLSILSSQLKERLSLSLPFKSLIGDSDVNQVIKVDSVRWVRPDCIVVGCFLLNVDGDEENYLVQVITSKGRKIADVTDSFKPIVLSFDNIFLDFRPDAVPVASGPNLFLSYLDLHGLAFIANRKILSQHVVLFCWSLDNEKNEAAMIEILHDTWIPHIEQQGDGEDNLILGLSVDKVSQNENVKFTLGEVETEVSPSCVLICLTVDGKISVFHFASALGTPVSPEDLVDSDVDEHALPGLSSEHERAQITSGVREESGEQTLSMLDSHELCRNQTDKKETEKVTAITNGQPSMNIKSQEKSITELQERKPILNLQTSKVDEPKIVPKIEVNKDSDIQRPTFGGKLDVKLEPLPFKTSIPEGLEPLAKGFSKTENQSIFEVKSSSSFLSGKAPLVSTNQQTDSSMESLGKMTSTYLQSTTSTNSQSTRPLTWSSGKVDSLKTFDGRSLSLPSNNVERRISENSDTNASQSVGDPVRTFTYSGLRSASGPGNFNSLSAYPVPQVPLQGSSAPGKSLESQPNKENHATRSPTGILYSETNVSKQFSNVEEIAKKLNNLLEGIEGKGGFKDASVASQEKAVNSLEDGIWALSDRCRMWRGIMDDQLREVQVLFDKTVQVLARKIYMEGIFKQATDSRYWDLWNRQKLSSELELKRRHILDLDQVLTNQMIELERHFNALELNKFGESRDLQTNRKASQGWRGQSRHIQALHSLHNTMTSQLAAAEQLSECLSKQMAILSIGSSAKEHDVKRKLFESIGLSYSGVSHSSSMKEKVLDTMPNKEQFASSCSAAAKEHSRRTQASLTKSYDPETVRRRRDSLDRSWASFEPPKTTVKRMLLQEEGEMKHLTPQLQKGQEVARSAVSNSSVPALYHSQDRGTPEMPEEQSIESSSPSFVQRKTGLLDRGVLVLPTKTSALTSQSAWETTSRYNAQGTHKSTDEKSKSSVPFMGNNDIFASSESKFVQQSLTHSHQPPSISTRMATETPTSTNNSVEIPGSNDKKLGFTKSVVGDDKHIPTMTGTLQLEPKFSLFPVSTFGSTPRLSLANQSQPSETMSSSISLQSSSTSSSSLPSTVNASSPLPSFLSKPTAPITSFATPSSSKTSIDITSQSQTSFSSSLSFTSNLSFSSPEASRISSFSPPGLESPKSLSKPTLPIFGSKADGISQTETSIANLSSTVQENITFQVSALQTEISTPTSDSKLEPLVSSVTTEFPINSKPGNQIGLGGMLSSSSHVASNIKSEEPYAAEVPSPIAVSSAGVVAGVKYVTSDASNEDEMDEEAPETDQTTELALGNLGGFMLGSTPNSSTSKPNPFGVSAVNRDATPGSSTFMSPSSGELFRPASFNFQSLQPSQPLQPTNVGAFSGGFNAGITSQVPAVSGFGQPAHIGSGQQALGSVLGGFGQSRQLGAGLTGNNVASASGFGSGFTGVSSSGFGGGFAAAAGGGFASLASGGGGFAAAAMPGGGFASAATAVTGFSGGSFGGFSNQQGGGGGFSAFSSSSGAARPPSELFTQMRK